MLKVEALGSAQYKNMTCNVIKCYKDDLNVSLLLSNLCKAPGYWGFAGNNSKINVREVWDHEWAAWT